MALTGVLRPGHIQIRVLDLDEGVHHYRDVLGLEETGRDASGRVYLRGWDERDHHSIILRQADRAGMDFFGFKVDSEATLAKLERDVQAWGLKTERIPAGDLLETGERVRFEIPSGHQIELYATKTFAGCDRGEKDPSHYSPKMDKGIAPMRFDHALLYGPNVDKVLDLFTNVLGFHLAEYVTLPDTDIKGALWLCCSNKAHDIAFVEHPEPGKLHHVSFYMESSSASSAPPTSWPPTTSRSTSARPATASPAAAPSTPGIRRATASRRTPGRLAPYPDWGPIRWDWKAWVKAAASTSPPRVCTRPS
jgi:catechol 2,3-dioxygenase